MSAPEHKPCIVRVMRWIWISLFASLGVACDGDGADGGAGGSTTTTTGTPASTQDGSSTTGMVPANVAPTAAFVITPPSGVAPLSATLDAATSTDTDGTIVSYAWDFDGMAETGVTVTRTFDTVGCHPVTLTVTDDDGATGTAEGVVVVAEGEPEGPPVVMIDEAPRASAVLPRDLVTDEGTARFHGTIDTGGYTEIVAEVLDGDMVVRTVSAPICGMAPAELAIDVPVPSELKAFDVRISVKAGAADPEEVFAVTDLVAGDIYVIQGQSNAVSSQFNGDASENESPFVRSFGSNTANGAATAADLAWRPAKANAGGGEAAIGQWPSRMAGELSRELETPIGIVNGAHGGQPIGFFLRNDEDVTDLATNYGRLLTRMQEAGLAGSVRAILWYQGESDGAAYQVHRDGFLALVDDWLEDYEGVSRIYITQVRAGCGADLIRLQEVQRTLPDEFPNMSVMSTTGLDAHDGCHYAYENGYRELGDRYVGLLSRDMYGAPGTPGIVPPNPMTATMVAGSTEISIDMRDPMQTLTFDDGAAANFRIEGAAVTVVSGSIVDKRIVLELSGPVDAPIGVTYLGHTGAGPWVLNENGIGLLEFYDLPVATVENI